ncbi:MAG: hypothetical protein HYZ24_09075 [Chloroflexi bacterium]|nr:hypothetical protein [Chloroflexota bacterium]
MKQRSLIAFLLIVTLFIFACFDSGDEYYTEEPIDDFATEAPADDGSGESTLPESAPGEVIYDFGFSVEQNGFSFENYGDESSATNLTETEMRRMFGDEVCAQINGDQCVLTPPAAQWMEQINGSMGGGHCEGMAVLSLLMYTDQVSPSDFGGSSASDLDINDENLQREIAYWWATQATDPTGSSVIKGTPMEIMETIQQMDAGSETYTIGIYNDRGEGHAITPFGVEDKGDGLYAILVYDNNYPGQVRELFIDSRDNSWTYETSINPEVATDVWSGNADTQTLDLTPTSARLQTQECSFCGGGVSGIGSGKFAALEASFNEIFLDGEGHILITDENGNRLGYVDGKIVNEIPGATYTQFRMAASGNTPEPIYSVPAALDLTIEIDGSTLTEESLTDLIMIGAGFSIGVEGIYLEPGQVDVAYFYPSEQTIAYETQADESPFIVIGVENPDAEADYYFEVQGADIQGGGIITVYLDTEAGDLLINAEKLSNEGSFDFYLTRITDELEEEFAAEEILLNEGAIVYVNYAEWTDANPEGMYFGVDLDGDGTIDEEYVVDDKQ